MSIKIAIADDNYFLQKTILEKLSFFTELQCRFTALNGKELLEKLEANHNIDLCKKQISAYQNYHADCF